MSRRSNFHALGRDIHARELFELVIHARQFALNVRCGIWNFLFDPRDVEEDAAVR